MPAHVTVIYPFMPAAELRDSDEKLIAATCRATASFDLSFATIARFENSVYLQAEPAAPVVGLVRALTRAFPEYPPYGGEFPEIIPHLTIAARPARLDVAESELRETLAQSGPIRTTCRELHLHENRSGRWEPFRSYALGTAVASGVAIA